MTKIEWTEQTWNPIVGCSVVSPGCTNCYAMKMAARIESMGGAPQYNGTTKASRGGPVWTGKVALAEKALLVPLKRKKPTMYFVNSMGDLFHEDVPDEWIDRVFAIMALCPQHTFQVLTKRAERMREYVTGAFDRVVMQMIFLGMLGWPTVKDTCEAMGIPYRQPKSAADWWPLRNVWLGVSAEDQTRADERISHLLETPAAVRFVSCEPLLGPICLDSVQYADMGIYALSGVRSDGSGPSGFSQGSRLHWLIVGGESGPNARPMDVEWASSLRKQCAAASVPFFMKQMGGIRKPFEPIPNDLMLREFPNAT